MIKGNTSPGGRGVIGQAPFHLPVTILMLGCATINVPFVSTKRASHLLHSAEEVRCSHFSNSSQSQSLCSKKLN